jgi:uncharacterized membrane protein YqiK
MSKLIIDVSTGEETLRELNTNELNQQEIDEANELAEAEAIALKGAAKAQAKAELLERLGITADEAKLLLA